MARLSRVTTVADRFSLKSLLIVLVFLLIPIVFLLRLSQSGQTAEAAWYNDSWMYRQQINVASHNVGETNVYLIATISISSTTKAQVTDGDFRFTTSNGQTLTYYIASGVGTTAITFHIQIPTFPAGAQTFYAYYGNPSAPNGATAADFATQASNYSIGSYGSEEAGGGPVSWWKLDEGVGYTAYDSSSSHNNGSVNVSTWATEDQCVSSKCLYFNGDVNNNYVSATNPLYTSTSSEITVSAWVNAKKATTTEGRMAASTYNWDAGGHHSGWNFGTVWTGDYFSFEVWDGNGGGATASFNNFYATYLNKWVYVTGVYKPSQYVRFYINGALVAQTTSNVPSSIAYPNNLLRIGRRNTQSQSYWNGYIDEVKVYSYARTQAQIYQDYNVGKAHLSSPKGAATALGGNTKSGEFLSNGLVAYYESDESAGTSLVDSSGLGATATVSGSANFAPGKFGNAFRPGVGSTNLFYNPSAENGLGYWGNWQATNTQTSATALFGTYSVLNTQTTGSGYTAFDWDNTVTSVAPVGGQAYTCSAYIKTDSAWAGKTGVFTFREIGGSQASSSNNNGSFTFTTSWQRVTVTRTIVQPDRTSMDCYLLMQGVNGNDGAYFYTDGIQAEVGSAATPYTDGTLGVGYSWTGSANASPSVNYSSSVGTTLYNDSSGSLAFWFKAPALDNVLKQCPLGSSSGDSTGGIFLGLQSSGVSFTHVYATGVSTVSNIPTTISNNTWYHLAYTWDNSTRGGKLYLNGTSIGSVSYAQAITIGEYLNSLGTCTKTGYSLFNGSLDDIRLYNRALQPSEISALYSWAPGPVGWWKFDEGAGSNVNDSSGNNLSAGWSGTGSHWGIGKYNDAGWFQYSKNDWAGVGSPAALQLTNGLTTGAWVKLTDYSVYNEILGKSDNTFTNRSFELRATVTTGIPQFIVYTTAGTFTAQDTVALGTNTWHYVAGTYDPNSSVIKLYVDGVQKTSVPASGTLLNSTQNLAIGALGYLTGGTGFNGYIDDARIYSYARSGKQIVEDLNAGHPAGGSPVGSMIGYWKMDEGYGSTVNNSGSLGSTLKGTIVGTTLPVSWSNNGHFGKAINFAGGGDINAGRISIPNDPSDDFKSGSDLSATFWVYRRSMTGNDSIFMKNGSWGIELPNNSVLFQNWGCGNSGDATVNVNLPLNQWLHIGVVYTDSNRTETVYLNGKLVGSNAGSSCLAAGSGSVLELGYLQWPNYTTLDGALDEVKLYNYALTATDIALDYNHGAALAANSFSSANTGNTAPASANSQLYCVPGDSTACAGPVAEWNFDEATGTTAYDTSGSGNNAVLGPGNSAPSWVPGKFNDALYFNGSTNYVNLNSLSSTSGTYTFNYWVKTNTAPSGYQFLLDSQNGRLVLGWASGSGKLGYYDSAGSWRQSNITPPADNKWHFLTYVLNAGTSLGTIYVDGIGQTSMPYQSTNIGATTILGARYTLDSYFFPGSIDQVRIYNYARTPAQIAWDYNRGGPVGWWKFDDCQGATALDASGLGNTGNISIGPSGTQNTLGTCQIGTSAAWTAGAQGKINSSLNFDGTDDYVSSPINSSLNTNDTTLLTWVYYKSNSQFQSIIQNMDGCATNGYFLTIGRLGNMDSKLWLVSGAGSTLNGDMSSNSTISMNAWHQVGFVWKSTGTSTSTQQLIIDGKIDATRSVNVSSPQARTGNLYLGYVSNCWGATYLNGQLDDTRLYNYALTNEQVKQLYNYGATMRFAPITGTP